MGFLDAAAAGAKSAARPPPPVSGGAFTRVAAQGAQQAAPSFASAVSQGASRGVQQSQPKPNPVDVAAQAARRQAVSTKQQVFNATLNNLLGKGGPLRGMLATAYGPPWDAMEGGGKTSTGIDLTRGQLPVIAVDPDVIPYGSIVKASNSPLGKNKLFVAADTGGAIKGNHIDFFVASGRSAQNGWGARQIGLQVLQKGSGPSSVRSALQKVQAAKAQVPPPKPPAASQRPAMVKERLFADPRRPASFKAGGATQIAQSKGLLAMRQEALKLLVRDPAKRKLAAQQLANPSQTPVLVSNAPSGSSPQASVSDSAPSSAPAMASSPAPASAPSQTLAALPAALQQSPIPASVAAQAKSAPILEALLRSLGPDVWNVPTPNMTGLDGLRGDSSPYLLLANELLRRGVFK
jgi:3D (Asp-Asp-Asp) domain-containing protein